jgi:hypothetical protein
LLFVVVENEIVIIKQIEWSFSSSRKSRIEKMKSKIYAQMHVNSKRAKKESLRKISTTRGGLRNSKQSDLPTTVHLIYFSGMMVYIILRLITPAFESAIFKNFY